MAYCNRYSCLCDFEYNGEDLRKIIKLDGDKELMYGLFEEKDIDKTIRLLETNGFQIVKENRKPSLYNTKNEVVVKDYSLSDRIITFLYSFHEPDGSLLSGQNVMVELKVDVDGREETLMNNASNYTDVESFVNADQNKINDMLMSARKRRAEAMNGLIKNLK